LSSIVITPVHSSDLTQLQAISRQTFTETFAGMNTEEDMEKYLRDNLSIDKLTEELQNTDSLFFFAKVGNEIAGYLKLNAGAAQTELTDHEAVEIERIYVQNAYQGLKIGKALFDKAVSVAKERKASYLWLGVWEENHKAIAFYEKNGFFAFDKHIFMLGNDPQTDIMMKLMLV
jgi:ribosomal protein S18 acetylase RimI-like enzyme